MKMTVADLKKLLDYVDDDKKVVVGCEGYCNYNFEEKRHYDGDGGVIQLTVVDGVLVIHPRNDNAYDYR